MYIADGHHRYETALGYWRTRQAAGAAAADPASRVLMLLVDVDDPGLAVFPTHRLLHTGARIDDVRARGQSRPVVRRRDAAGRAVAPGPALAALSSAPGRHAFAVLTPEASTFILRSREGADLRSLMPEGHSDAWYDLDASVLHEVVLPRGFLIGEDAAALGEIAFTRDAGEAGGGRLVGSVRGGCPDARADGQSGDRHRPVGRRDAAEVDLLLAEAAQRAGDPPAPGAVERRSRPPRRSADRGSDQRTRSGS